jgi:peptidoglycan hydrolase-like protein with peptidoglycan-binding domain
MKHPANVMACLGFIGAAGLFPLASAIAAVPSNGTSGSTMNSSPSGIAPASGPAQARHATHSQRVALVQEALDSTGAKVRIDGAWGPATEAALKHYQRQNGLVVTGQLDKATQTKLDPTG